MDNEGRASAALSAVMAFQDAMRTDDCDAIPDLLADLGHLSWLRGEPAFGNYRRGIANFVAELRDPPDGMGPAINVEIDISEQPDRPSYRTLSDLLDAAVSTIKYLSPEKFDDEKHRSNFESFVTSLETAVAKSKPIPWLINGEQVEPLPESAFAD